MRLPIFNLASVATLVFSLAGISSAQTQHMQFGDASPQTAPATVVEPAGDCPDCQATAVVAPTQGCGNECSDCSNCDRCSLRKLQNLRVKNPLPSGPATGRSFFSRGTSCESDCNDCDSCHTGLLSKLGSHAGCGKGGLLSGAVDRFHSRASTDSACESCEDTVPACDSGLGSKIGSHGGCGKGGLLSGAVDRFHSRASTDSACESCETAAAASDSGCDCQSDGAADCGCNRGKIAVHGRSGGLLDLAFNRDAISAREQHAFHNGSNRSGGSAQGEVAQASTFTTGDGGGGLLSGRGFKGRPLVGGLLGHGNSAGQHSSVSGDCGCADGAHGGLGVGDAGAYGHAVHGHGGLGHGGLGHGGLGHGGLGHGGLMHRSGCGVGGCGQGGRLCARCAGGRFQRGEIPHTEQPNYGADGMAGGQAPTYAYPYYTTRAPRDFLMDNPPSIGW